MSVKKIILHGKTAWQFDVMVNGKRIRKASTKWNRKQCMEKEREAVLNAGITEDITYGELFKQYIAQLTPQSKASTIRKHEGTHRLYIEPTFGKVKLEKISKPVIIKWQEDLLQRDYSANTLSSIQNLFHAVLNYAVERELIDSNPFKFKKVTKLEPKEELIVWTPQDFEKFAANIDDPTQYALFRTLYFGGLRKGELVALNVGDFDGHGIHITKTYDRVLHQTTPPKTRNSYRYVELDKRTCEAISDLVSKYTKIENLAEMPLFGFSHRIGFTTMEKWKDDLIKKADVPYITMHGFRHSHASYLLEHGIRTRDVALRLGNTEEMVIKRYSHIINRTQNHITALFE